MAPMERLRATKHPRHALVARGSAQSQLEDLMIVVDVRDMPPEQWRLGVEAACWSRPATAPPNCASSSNGSHPAPGAPTHTHPVEEVLTVREGEAEMWMDDQRITVLAGQSLVVPANRVHGFRNSGTVTLHIHAVLASPIFEAMVEGAAEITRRWGVQ
jgi:mannose-6-phosphate isomerase-like protein (cupin superfamily)